MKKVIEARNTKPSEAVLQEKNTIQFVIDDEEDEDDP